MSFNRPTKLMESKYGLKLLAADGGSLTTDYPRVTYPVGVEVEVPGNGAYITETDGLCSGGIGQVLAYFHHLRQRLGDGPRGVGRYRYVTRLAHRPVDLPEELGRLVEETNEGFILRWWRDNKRLYHEMSYEHGQCHGIERHWHANGQLRSEVPYKYGELCGMARYWHGDGQLGQETSYEHGKRHGIERCWDKDGRLEHENLFECGEPYSFGL